MERVRSYRVEVAVFRALLDPIVQPLLAERYHSEACIVLDEIWAKAVARWTKLPSQTTPGATITVHLAAVTAAAYDTLRARHETIEIATQNVHDIAWAIYRKMGAAAWTASGFLSLDDAERMRVATVAFRTFPFSAPSYVWKDVPSPAGVVEFDCLERPVAEYFKAQQLSELCVQTWCALDFSLAEKVWHAKLERAGSIAGGQSHCDLRWSSASERTSAARLQRADRPTNEDTFTSTTNIRDVRSRRLIEGHFAFKSVARRSTISKSALANVESRIAFLGACSHNAVRRRILKATDGHRMVSDRVCVAKSGFRVAKRSCRPESRVRPRDPRLWV